MDGTYEANMTLHDCDFMVTVDVRFDDRTLDDLILLFMCRLFTLVLILLLSRIQ